MGGGDPVATKQPLVLPAVLPILNSLTISASDIELQIPTATLTVGTLAFGTNGTVITGAQATGTILVATTAFTKADGGNATFSLSNFNLTLGLGATATWEGDANVTGLSISSFGAWTWVLTSYLQLTTSLDNYAAMTLQYGAGATINVGVLVIVGDVNLWAGSSLKISTDCAFQVGNVQYGGGGTVAYNFNIYSAVEIDGTLTPTDNANVSFLAGSSVSGLGAIFYQAASEGSFLYLDIDFTFQNLQLAGLGTVYSNGHSLTISQLDLAGGSIAGTGPLLAHNVTSNNYDGNVNTGTGVYLVGRNLTVDQYWDMRNLPNFFLSNGANVITASTCSVFMNCNANFKQLPSDTSVVAVQAGGTWTANIVPLVNSTDCQILFNVPLIATGTFTSPANSNTSATTTGLFVKAGGVFAGTMNAPTNAALGSTPANWRVAFETGPAAITSGATFNGGVTEFTSNCSDPQYTNAACYSSNFYSWQAAGGSGIIVSDEDVTFSIDAAGVQFTNYWAQSGQITGANNLTIVNGTRDDTNLGGMSNWQINGTNVNIQNTFNMNTPQVTFVNGGTLGVLKGGILNLANGINDSATSAAPAGVYNYGRTIFTVQQNSYVSVAANFYNYGEIDLGTVVTDSNSPKGATLNITGTARFVPQAGSQIDLNVYSATDADKVYWDTRTTTCYFLGQFNAAYQYTPSAYDKFLALITTDTTSFCQGIFSIGYTGAPANHTPVMVYDQPATDGSGAAYYYIQLCPNTNATCLAQANRDPTKASTVGTVSTTGSTTDTTQGATTQGTNSPTPTPTSGTPAPTPAPSSTTKHNSAATLFVAPVLILLSALVCML
eukprot:Phypoly_transcript_02386.p1 GENE.Phypoly_transcript_02386~~Phypoly_transcript_02386.p1  ORF type:complete len:913 (+),score=186.05 Phypoly_transcript_02386:241-2739(+)